MADDGLAQMVIKGREGFIGYRATGRVLLVPGEPICATSDAYAFFSGLLEHAITVDKAVCFFGCSHRLSYFAQSAGYEAIKIGEEAFLDLPGFSL